ncbi:SH3 domain-containing protein [Nesterenkonia lutea]|uniref:Uncharacterized protein YraI/biotin carboxyl carrier protein n=1 Tax=Nesterenkonia lutea TaxID=272919 RepID=A0ABR9JFY7_9MICC|nr:SH3 domain-containing protein [Nesterenkonia lutea]MBE1524844.1 uncharacterized protein YraI/biotin carboxyl carrier protein [Nesterenkonia lutea]
MPKKLSSAVVGTLAVGLTMPLTANAAAAAPVDVAPLPAAGVNAPAAGAASLSTVDIAATRSATTFRYPLASRSFSYTSPYGARCMPTQGASTYHLGQDLGAANGSPIYSVADGTVVRTFSGNRYNAGYVVVQHRIGGRTFHSAYFHMWDANSHVRIGQSVKAGQTIARVGSSGPSTGPHLHLEIWEGAWLSGTSHNPTTWLAQRGVNLRSAASTVLNISAPASCDYYTASSTPLRSTASSSGSIIRQLGAGTALTAVPGDIRNSMVRVKTNGRTGWVAHSAVTPSRPSGSSTGTTPASSAPKGTSVTPTKYRTTTSLNARSGPGTNYAVQQGLASGTQVTVTAKYGSWLKFSRNGQTVWSHGDYLKKVASSSSGSSTSTPASSTTAASGTYKVKSGVSLRARSGAGTSNSIVKVLKPGTTVKVTGKNGGWLSYKDGSRTLWLQSSWLDKSTASSTPASSTTSASGTYKVKSGVSLRARSGAGTSNSIVKVLKPGTTVKVTGKNGGWLSYKDGSRTLWLQSSWLDKSTASSTPASSTTSASGTYKVKSGVSLRARSGAGTSNSIVKVLKPGTTVKVTGKNGGWLSYKDGSRTLWLQSSWLDKSTASSTSASSTTSASGTYQVKSGVYLNARTGASTSSSKAKVLKPGTTVKVTGKSGVWLSYKDGSRTLWLHSGYLNKGSSSNGTGSGSGTVPGGPESSSSSGETTTAASGTYKVKSGVSLRARSGAGTSNSIVKVLKPGTTVKVTGKKGEWFSFKDGSRTLWLQSTWLDKSTASSGSSTSSSDSSDSSSSSSKSSTSSPSTASGTFQVKSGISLNARTGASTSSSSAKVLKAGTKISVTGKKGEWVSFKDGSRTLWVHSGYLIKATASASSGSSTSSKSSTSSTSTASGTFQVKSGISLNARTGASSSSSSAKVLKAGTKISITGKKGDWVSFKDGSRTLWVHSGYLVKASSASSSSGSTSSSSSSSKSSTSSTSTASGTFQVKSGISLNARTGASSSSSSAKVLKAGTKISITGKKGDWVSFKDGSRTLWVHSGYLIKATASASSGSSTPSSSDSSSTETAPSSDSGSSTKSASGTYHVKSNVYLNARSGPGTSYRIVLNLNPKREIQITGRNGDWVSFTYSGKTVWVNSDFLNSGSASASASSSSSDSKDSSGGSSSSEAPKANSTNSSSKVVGTAYSSNTVNVRMGPSTNNSVMFSVPTGTKVELLQKKTDGWQEVKVNGATGWMSAQLLTSKAPSSTGTASSGSSNTGSSGSTSGSGTSTSSNMHAKSKNGPYSQIWDKLAQCESGQNWKIDTGNGFYGGVQFSPESWEAVGGSGFPHEASKEEQIKRAYMLYKKQGWNAWPLCNQKLGLSGDPGGYGDSYYKVHPDAKTVSNVSAAGTWTATYSVPLRESAATSGDKLVQVPRGTELKQLKREGSWLKVEYTSGGETHTGWVNTSYISQA